MDVINNLKEATRLLDEIEEYENNINGADGSLAKCDNRINYWLHYLEFNPLRLTDSYKIIREIKRLRMERRQYKNDAELIRTYKEHIGKLNNKDNRSILVTTMHKKKNIQEKREYSSDVYTEEELNDILGFKKKEIKNEEVNEN